MSYEQVTYANVEQIGDGMVSGWFEEEGGDEAPPESQEQAQLDEEATNTEEDDQQIVTSPGDNELIENEESFFSIFVRMIGALAVVIVLIYALLRFFNNRTRAFQSHRTIQNVGGVGLGANRSVQLIKVGDRLLVVGVGESIQLLKEVTNKEEIDQMMRQQNEKNEVEPPFAKATAWLGKKMSPTKEVKKESDSQFGVLLDKQLKGVSKSQQKIHQVIKEKKHE
ncbi:flagellar biosynthetic protein FliO [Desertibacillus haloalkaliphilus]|uniref:flagellar biosynthetic protein FliO n=1 Tax=Desertibacillus haloalkaliphilus TaxID=1328930 RepID=UPI001C254DDA|nr:flagellar biosynthetic protein FliO [Desertibacillus haloalkaliphilus]MBU8907000.1 flagellar biosynthetic protein FliO [Desertibacillus haloalkaliphilus]